MCSEGVSVWFACKLCKCFFLNADDFAYHKKKYHIQEFRSTKFIVFEEQTTSTASPPENWISFLPPKEETRIHKIISPPSAPATTTTILNYNPSNKCIQSNQNEKLIEINPECNEDCNDFADAGEESNNCFKLNYDFNSTQDAGKAVDANQNGPLQNSITPFASTDSDLTDGMGEKHCTTVTSSAIKYKTNRLKKCRLKNRDVPSSSNNTASQTYDNISNKSVSSESILSHNVDKTCSKTASHTASDKCRFCSKTFKSDFFQEHVELCKNQNFNHEEREPNNLVNKKDHIPNPTTESSLNCGDLLTVIKTEYVADGNEIDASEFPKEDQDQDREPDSFESESWGDESFAEETVNVAAATTSSNNSDNKLTSKKMFSRFCFACEKYFGNSQELKNHNKNDHVTQDGRLSFKCPHSNCGLTTKGQCYLRRHLMQAHSNVRPFICPDPICRKPFKTLRDRDRHFKRHTKPM